VKSKSKTGKRSVYASLGAMIAIIGAYFVLGVISPKATFMNSYPNGMNIRNQEIANALQKKMPFKRNYEDNISIELNHPIVRISNSRARSWSVSINFDVRYHKNSFSDQTEYSNMHGRVCVMTKFDYDFNSSTYILYNPVLCHDNTLMLPAFDKNQSQTDQLSSFGRVRGSLMPSVSQKLEEIKAWRRKNSERIDQAINATVSEFFKQNSLFKV